MQDKAIAAIGEWQLEKNKDLEPVDLYIENMFPGKDYQMLLLVFEINITNGELVCNYKGIDIEKVSAEKEDYRKYAYRKGSARGGDITPTTKISTPVKTKISGICNTTLKNISSFNKKHNDIKYFNLLNITLIQKLEEITNYIDELFANFTKDETVSSGLSFKIIINEETNYIRDFELIKEVIISSGATSNYIHSGTESKTKNKISSLSGQLSDEVFGFAAPYKYSSPDKPGFISGFFNKKYNWRNYPIGSNETLSLELGRKFIQQNLTGYFYGNEYMIVPHPIIKTKSNDLELVIKLLKTAFDDERQSKELKKRSEDRVQKTIAQEKNYFYVDMLFYKEDKKTGAISINLMIEELLPSRFRQLFIDTPAIVNQGRIFKNAITIKKELQNLTFSFQIIKVFFEKTFLEIVHKIFIGTPISKDLIFTNIIAIIRKNYNASKTADGWVEPLNWTVKKAIMLLNYLQELNIINYNQNYKYMEPEITQKKESRFFLEGFNEFVKENNSFLDSDIKVGIFSVGVLTRFLFDIQYQSLKNTPFENKLRGYKLNPELLMQVYTEALDKIQKYQKSFFIYNDLREIINKNFVLKTPDLAKMTNNELSFYFVAGLEMGKQFKKEKQIDNQY